MRVKIIAGNLLAVLITGLLSWFIVSSQVEATLVAEVDESIPHDHQLFEQRWRLSSYELLQHTVAQAAETETREVFTALNQRQRANERADTIRQEIAREDRSHAAPPEIVAITNDLGWVVARDQDANRMRDANLTRQGPDGRFGALTTLQGVLSSGEPASDVWLFSSSPRKILQTAVAPIRGPEGRIIGALIVGYDISNGMASAAAEVLGRDLAVIEGDSIYSSSMETQGEALSSQLFGDALRASTEAALGDGGQTSDRYVTTVGDDEFIGVTGPLPLSQSHPVAYAVLGSRTAQSAKASPTIVILVMTAIAAIFVLVYGFLIGGLFLKPIEQMEAGVLAVINGRTDLRIDVKSEELGGLAYGINQLLNVFTGTPEEDEEGRVSSPPEAWAAAEAADAPAAPPAAPASPAGGSTEEEDPALAAALEAEHEDAYYTRIYTEYVAAKEAAGENVSNITQERFVKRLQANEKSLIRKHDCRMVRFQVQVRGTQVNLRPVVIR